MYLFKVLHEKGILKFYAAEDIHTVSQKEPDALQITNYGLITVCNSQMGHNTLRLYQSLDDCDNIIYYAADNMIQVTDKSIEIKSVSLKDKVEILKTLRHER